jgi:hypothetical protein
MTAFEKIVLVTRRTRLEALVERFNSRGQARFYIERAGGDFSDYVAEDDAYRARLEELRRALELGLKFQAIDRSLVPTVLFTEKDLVVVLGQDGLVANVAKYVGGQPIVGVNPDPARFDGILLPFQVPEAAAAVRRVLAGQARLREVTLAEARLNDGQRMLAFNDLFVGAATHVSARYRISFGGRTEPHSSSGLLVSTGAGSTGWLSSVFAMASGVAALVGGRSGPPIRLDWGDRRLLFVVREPFVSKHSRAGVVAGMIGEGGELVLESLMPSEGVIFSDGVEADRVAFNSGATARIGAADRRARLVVA